MNKVSKFWNWFEENEDRLFHFGMDDDVKDIIDEVHKKLSRVHKDLMFEFSSQIGGSREFIVSAGGISKLIPYVDKVVAAAPPLPRWKIFAFRQRSEEVVGVRLQDGSIIEPESVTVSLEPDRGRIGLTLFFDGLDETNYEYLGQIGFLMLDRVLGEYDVMKKMGFIEFKSSSEPSESRRYPIRELAKPFDEMYAQFLN